MTEDQKQNSNSWRLPDHPEDVKVVLGDVRDLPAAAASLEIDAAADRKWLKEHPEAAERLRPPSVRELAAFDLPPDTQVVVVRGPMGSQSRMFLTKHK